MTNLDYLSGDLYAASAMVKMDVTHIKYQDNTFDCILCLHVLEHIEDDIKAMKEIHRVLKPGGWFILQVPIKGNKTYEDPNIRTPEERLKHFGQHDHVRVYGRDYEERLESAGFCVKVDGYVRSLPKVEIERLGII